MNKELLIALQKEENAAFSGWDFSHLNGRWEHGKLPWDYKSIVKNYLKDDDSLLDMGTGGGEFILSLEHPYELTSVTEGYEPNYKLCLEKLGKLGVKVKFIGRDNILPFNDAVFDIVINRHEEYLPEEVRRVLKPGGFFITQQVGGRNNTELSRMLVGQRRKLMLNWDMHHVSKELEQSGFEMLYKDESFPNLKFFDTRAIVYFAKAVVWEFPDFSVTECFSELEKIEEQMKVNGVFESREHRFVIVGRV